jgi:RNA polymerase sigma-70 factor (ECF subfamily)
MVDKTSSSLLRRLRNPGDHESWGEFVAIYEPLLLRYVRKKGVNETDAHDVVQGIFISLLRQLPKFELNRGRGRFRTWLWQVSHNAVIDWARSRKRRQNLHDEVRQNWDEAAEAPDEEWDQELQKRVLEVATGKIRLQTNPTSWACFEKYLLAGKSGAEVAAELNLPVNTVYVYAARVMARVRAQCEAYLEELADE